MKTKAIRTIKLSDTLTLSEFKNGYWLYDKTRGMNLAMKAKTEQDAYVKAITYYQKRCAEIELKKNKMYDNVNKFIESLSDDEEVCMGCDCDDC